jgi:hypothetical protein
MMEQSRGFKYDDITIKASISLMSAPLEAGPEGAGP